MMQQDRILLFNFRRGGGFCNCNHSAQSEQANEEVGGLSRLDSARQCEVRMKSFLAAVSHVIALMHARTKYKTIPVYKQNLQMYKWYNQAVGTILT